jgi:hypothetical protein
MGILIKHAILKPRPDCFGMYHEGCDIGKKNESPSLGSPFRGKIKAITPLKGLYEVIICTFYQYCTPHGTSRNNRDGAFKSRILP